MGTHKCVCSLGWLNCLFLLKGLRKEKNNIEIHKIWMRNENLGLNEFHFSPKTIRQFTDLFTDLSLTVNVWMQTLWNVFSICTFENKNRGPEGWTRIQTLQYWKIFLNLMHICVSTKFRSQEERSSHWAWWIPKFKVFQEITENSV